MIVIADAGGSSTQWAIIPPGGAPFYFQTPGLHCMHFRPEYVEAFVHFLESKGFSPFQVTTLYFYGAGCVNDIIRENIRNMLFQYFSNATIVVDSDVVAASLALFDVREGITVIMGTGSAVCVWNGRVVVDRIPSLGYLLGDEGSGFAIARAFLKLLLRNLLSPQIKQAFLETYQIQEDQLLQKIYDNTNPRMYIASFMPFILSVIHHAEVRKILLTEIEHFINLCLLPIRKKYPLLPVGFCGSVAYQIFSHAYFMDYLCSMLNLKIEDIRVLQNPIEHLVSLHVQNLQS